MNIEIVTSYFLPLRGGIELIVEHLAEGFGKNGHKVCIHTALRIPGVKETLPKFEEKKYYMIKRYPIFPYSFLMPEPYFKDSVFSLHNYSALMNDYFALMYPKRKKVLTPYGTITYNLEQRQHQYLAPLYDKYIGKRTLFAMDKIVAMTPYEQKAIVKKYPKLKGKVVVSAAGIDFLKESSSQSPPFSFKYFLSIGRVAHTKRFEDMLHTLKSFPEYHYVLAGRDLGYAAKLQNLATELGVDDRFHYLGRETKGQEKITLLKNASLFIMPSSAEAFSIASLEAFYYTGRVVGAKSGGIVDLYKEFGGELYDIGNIIQMKSSISKALEKKYTKSTAEKYKQQIKQKYSWDNITNEYEEILST